jgi:hypothetical protein
MKNQDAAPVVAMHMAISIWVSYFIFVPSSFRQGLVWYVVIYTCSFLSVLSLI